MAILAIFTSTDITIDHYETLRKSVGWEVRQPPGAMLHTCSFEQDGSLRVVDIWASRGELERFLKDRLEPALEALDLAPPAMEVYPLHNINAFPTLVSHQLSR